MKFIDHSLTSADYLTAARFGRFGRDQQFYSSDHEFLHMAASSMSWRPPPPPPVRRSVVDAMTHAIHALVEVPGRKSLIWIGPGIDSRNSAGASWEEMRRIADSANRASVTVYSVHSTALPDTTAPAMQAEPAQDPRSGRKPSAISFAPRSDAAYFRAEREMIEISEMTAGLFQPYSNDLVGEITKAVDDFTGYYMIGWYPGEGAFRPSPANRIGYHNVRIQVRGREQLRNTRMGFYATVGISEPSPFDSEAKAQEALFSPFQTGEIDVRLLASFESTGAGGGRVRSLLHIEPNGIVFWPDAASPGCAIANLEGTVLHPSYSIGTMTLRLRFNGENIQRDFVAKAEVAHCRMA